MLEFDVVNLKKKTLENLCLETSRGAAYKYFYGSKKIASIKIIVESLLE